MSEVALPLGRVAEVLRDSRLLLEGEIPEDVLVQGVSQDSRTVGPGELFLCWKGTDHDAHDHLEQAVNRGAVAAVVERRLPELSIPQLHVRDGRRAAALAADLVFGSPWKELFTVGVTGTNGKTTTTLLARLLLALREPAAALGTLGLVGPDGAPRPGTGSLTTPGPVQVARSLRDLADEGVRSVVLEASSHALEQRRLDGLRFDVAVFTNFSQDHLDYHSSKEAYLQAKARLIELLSPAGSRVVNAGDRAWEALPPHPGREISYAIERADGDGEGTGTARLRARNLRLGPEGADFDLTYEGETARTHLPLLGRFNVENALAAAGAAVAGGRTLSEIARGLAEAPQFPGRLEVVARRAFTVVVDFAHTPAALSRVLETLRELFPGRTIVVFGAGGDRDPSKRIPMGRAVAAGADLPIVTSDNPRTEDPEAIVDEIAQGLAGVPYERVVDRRDAIRRALEVAREGDVVLLAGKGHERDQVVGRERRPFDEPAIVAELLEAGGG